jgi:hypothetical protein
MVIGPHPQPAAPRRYGLRTRDPAHAVLLVLPVFVVYQVGILFTDGWRNGADFITPFLLHLCRGDLTAYSFVQAGLVLTALGYWLFSHPVDRLQPLDFVKVVSESTLWAFLLGPLVAESLMGLGFVPARILPADTAGAPALGVLDALVLSAGAGAYEELFFRVFLMTGGALALMRLRVRPWLAWSFALLGSSLVFSAFHYVPIGGEAWALWSFLFRVALGMLFGLLYVFRGFAVAVYTHTLYDILILVPTALGLL